MHKLPAMRREAGRKHFFFICKARLAVLLIPSHTVSLHMAKSCKLFQSNTEQDLKEHFYAQATSTACQQPHCFSPDRTEDHLCPAAGTQRGLPASPTDAHFAAGTAPCSHGRPAPLYKTWVLKMLKLLKQKKFVTVYILKKHSYTCASNYTDMTTPITIKITTNCVLFPIPQTGHVTYPGRLHVSNSHLPKL